MSWRDEARQDRLVRAQIARDQAAADAQARIAEGRAAAAERRADMGARDERRGQRQAVRARRRAARLAWLGGHVVDVLFIPVIVVPGLLAWTAMAAYGRDLYGLVGLALPAFSEGGMWVFAFARTLTMRRHPDRPTWHLLAGVWVFAGAGAGLNFLHGLTAPGNHAHPGIGTGAVMALVSAAGVTAHQLVTAGPRRGRAARQQERLDRAAARHVLAVRRAAIRHAAAELAEDGTARLVIRTGLVTVTRSGRLVRAAPPEAPADDWTSGLADLAAIVAAEIGDLAASLRRPLPAAAAAYLPVPVPVPAPGAGEVPVPEVHPELNGHREQAAGMFAGDLAAGTLPSIRAIRAGLHVGQPRAQQVQEYLLTLVPEVPAARRRADLEEDPAPVPTDRSTNHV